MQKVKICPHCQAASEEGALYCSLCGASFGRRYRTPDPEVPAPITSPRLTERSWFGTLIGVGIALLVFAGLWLVISLMRRPAPVQAAAPVTAPPLASHPAPAENPALPDNPFEKSKGHRHSALKP